MVRRAAKVDDNQERIVKALRDYGCKVAHTHMVGNGFPDIAVLSAPGADGKRRIGFAEIKDGKKPPSARRLTSGQVKFWDEWAGAPMAILEDVDGALRFARALAFESCGSK